MENNHTDLRKLQKVEKEILDLFAFICEKYHLSYFLVGGTCLGAIRHSGFIPWDDDIDVGMPRDDYEKFCDIVQKELGNQYFFQNFDTEENCGLVFGKIRKNNTTLSEPYSYKVNMHQGVWIDIFPFDYVNENDFIRKLNYYILLVWKNLYIVKCGYLNPNPDSLAYKIMYKICQFVVLFFSKKFLIQRIKNRMISKKKTSCVFPYGGAYPKKEMIPLNMIENLTPWDFEGSKFMVFKDYDTYLKQLYNDYMQFPPEDQRHGGHYIYEIKVD